jgi:hypothetical protein
MAVNPENIAELVKGAALGLIIACIVITIYSTARVKTINFFKNFFNN